MKQSSIKTNSYIVNVVDIVEVIRVIILFGKNHGSIGNQLPFDFSRGETFFEKNLVILSLLCSF